MDSPDDLRTQFIGKLGRVKDLAKEPQSIADELARWVKLIDYWKKRPFRFDVPPTARELAKLAGDAVRTAERAIGLLSAIYEPAQIETAKWDEHGRMIDGDVIRRNGHRMCESLNFIRRELDVIESAQNSFAARADTERPHPTTAEPLIAREIALRLRDAGISHEGDGFRVHVAAARWVWSLLELETNPRDAMRTVCERRPERLSAGDSWDGVPFRYRPSSTPTLHDVWRLIPMAGADSTD